MDWKTCTDKKEKYQLYLQSREWAELRNKVRERANGICERCSWQEIHAVHHLTYKRIYNEELSDLRGLCKGCHEFIHGHNDVDPIYESPFAKIAAKPEMLASLAESLFAYGVLYANGWRYDLCKFFGAVVITSPDGEKAMPDSDSLYLLLKTGGLKIALERAERMQSAPLDPSPGRQWTKEAEKYLA